MIDIRSSRYWVTLSISRASVGAFPWDICQASLTYIMPWSFLLSLPWQFPDYHGLLPENFLQYSACVFLMLISCHYSTLINYSVYASRIFAGCCH